MSDTPEPSQRQTWFWLLTSGLGLIGLTVATFWFLRLPTAPSRAELKKRLKSIGELTLVQANVESRFTQSPDYAPIQNENLVAGETVQSDATGRAEILLDTGESLELTENSRILFELDLEGKTRATILAGGLELKSTLSDHVVFLRDGRVVGVDELLAARSHTTIAPKTFAAGVIVPTKSTTIDEGNAALKAADAPPQDSDLTTLTQDEILRALQGQAPLFRKCYLNLLQETRNETNKVNALVAFEIQSNGKLDGVRIWHANVKSRIFSKCISESFERTHFRAFQGETIKVDEFPLSFE